LESSGAFLQLIDPHRADEKAERMECRSNGTMDYWNTSPITQCSITPFL